MITIEFEDHGQDFLEWDVNEKTGEIMASRPFQDRVWKEWQVFNHAHNLKPGKYVDIIKGDCLLTINYRIESITIKPN